MGLVMLSAGNTHLYPGARVRTSAGELRRGDDVVIEFADLGSARGRVVGAGAAGVDIDVASHTTARGTTVAPKHWTLRRVDACENGGEYRVMRRDAGRR
jgi:hypothetical protein